MPQRGRRVGVAKRLQPIEGCVGASAADRGWGSGPPCPAAGSRTAAHAAGVPAGRCGARCSAAPSPGRLVAERTSQPAKIIIIVGQHVRTPQAGTAGCDARACAGTGRPGRSPCRPHVPRNRCRSRILSAGRVARDPQPLVDPAVHQLQQLDGELDVAQAALAELELAAWHRAPECGRPPVCASPGYRRRSSPAPPRATPSAPPGQRSPARVPRSPAAGRALSIAWNSQVFAHFS